MDQKSWDPKSAVLAWIGKLITTIFSSSAGESTNIRKRSRLELESLEDRVVLADYYWTPGKPVAVA
jgi:hypothetical protein